MGDAWRDASVRLRQIEPPSDLWERIEHGPSLGALPPDPRRRVAAAVTALGVFAVVAALVFATIGPLGSGARTIGGSNVVAVPSVGDVAPVFLDDGRPVFVVRHEDRSISVVDAFSSHRAWGVEELMVWCPTTREFVELAHETRFDEFGAWAGVGPAPTGVPTFAFEPVEVDGEGPPVRIRIGEMQPPSAEGSPSSTPPSRPELCPGVPVGALLGHSLDGSVLFDTPAQAIDAAPTGWIAVRGTLFVARDGFVQLCAEIDGERCLDGAVVRGVDGIGLMLNVTSGPDVTAYEEPHVWLAQVRNGVLDDVAMADHMLHDGVETPESEGQVLDAPPIGEAAAGFTWDGTPFLVVRHEDGGLTAVEAISPHVATGGIRKLLGWCASSRTFDDAFHGSRFDEYGRYVSGPSPTGLRQFEMEFLSEEPLRFRLGELLTAPPRDGGSSLEPVGPLCTDLDATSLVMPEVAASGLTPEELVDLAPGGRWSIEAVLHLTPDGDTVLCAAVVGDQCRGGAAVVGPDASSIDEPLSVESVWLVLVEDSRLADPIRVPG